MADKTVTIPGTKSKVPRWAAYAGLGAVAVLIIVYYRRNKNTAATAAAGTTAAGLATPAAGGSDPYPWDGTYNNPNDPYSMDTATGITYGDEAAGIGGSGFGFTGGGGGGIGGQGGTGTGGVAGPPFSTNTQWAAYVIAQLEANDPNLNTTDVQNAIGDYLNGQPVPASLKNIVFDAIAIGGEPPVAGPNGFPPKVQSTGTQTGGGGGGGKTVRVPKVTGLRVEEATGILARAGLRYRFGTRQPGRPYWVNSQTPAAGKTEPAGSYVDLGITDRNPAGQKSPLPGRSPIPA